jgi:two-component system cell cycle response regulator
MPCFPRCAPVNERLPAIPEAARMGHQPVSVAIVDLDHFKRINDALSHNVGDVVLQQVSVLLAEAAADDSFIAARLGGEEFLLVMPGVDAGQALARCERLRERIRAYVWQPITGDLSVTTSIGVTTIHQDHRAMPELLAQADENLYAAKRGGRDRVVTNT